MTKKPNSLDSVTMTSLNTRIACEGHEYAESGYRRWCLQADVEVEEWVVNYFRLYAKYRNPSSGSYIDVKASKRALEEA